MPCFSDDYEGFATAVLAATLGAVPETGRPLQDQRVLIVGDSVNRIPIAELLATAAAHNARSMISIARQNIYLADDLGLVTATSEHFGMDGEVMREVLLYAKDAPDMKDLEQVCKSSFSCHAYTLRREGLSHLSDSCIASTTFAEKRLFVLHICLCMNRAACDSCSRSAQTGLPASRQCNNAFL
jgi:hypothetical protein